MCILTAEEEEEHRKAWLKVTRTNIFARHTHPGYQGLVYSLSIASKTACAMILPLPVVPGSGEDALKFIDLSEYEEFFLDMSIACCLDDAGDLPDLGLDDDLDDEVEYLVVHEVGDFEASYVPTMADFTRLDPRFCLPEKVWQKMPDYSDYGFVVFQLKISLMKSDEEIENRVHPMAFEFKTRNSEKLYYPTVHIHDGDYHNEAGYYHTFYCQRENARTEFKYQRDLLEGKQPTPPQEVTEYSTVQAEKPLTEKFYGYDWFRYSMETAGKGLKIDKCAGLVDPDKNIYEMILVGKYPNRDIWLGDTCHEQR